MTVRDIRKQLRGIRGDVHIVVGRVQFQERYEINRLQKDRHGAMVIVLDRSCGEIKVDDLVKTLPVGAAGA